MLDEQRKNLLSGTRDWSGSWGNTWAWSADGTHDGFAVMSRRDAWFGLYKLVRLAEGVTYTFSASVKMHAGGKGSIFLSGGDTINDTTLADQEFDHPFKEFTCTGEWQTVSLTFTPLASKSVLARVESYDSSGISVCAYMLVEGTTPAAWAPYSGEDIAGGGGLSWALTSSLMWSRPLRSRPPCRTPC